MPSQPEPLTQLQVGHARADCGNGADDLVTGYERKLGNPLRIVEHAQIAVADAAVFDFDFDLLRSYRAWIIFKGFQFTTGFKCGVGFNHLSTSLAFRMHNMVTS